MKVGITGAGGFIGTVVADAMRSADVEVVPVRSPRFRLRSGETAERFLRTWPDSHASRWGQLHGDMTDVDVLVNAAGIAAPESSDVEALDGANGLLPALLARAGSAAGIGRLIHVSSAAVQGDREPLDEAQVYEPFSPYSRSKVLGEKFLLEAGAELPVEVVIHRSTSVQGAVRPITQRLVRLAGQRLVPLCGDGDAPLPITLVENVAAAITFLATAADPPRITLQPWEGMTARSLFEAFGDDPRFASLPAGAWRVGAKAASWRSPAVGRRIELLAFGQRQEAKVLPTMGFEPPLVGPEAYRGLAKRTREYMEALEG